MTTINTINIINTKSKYMTKTDIMYFLLEIYKKISEKKAIDTDLETLSTIDYLFESENFNNFLSNIKFQTVLKLELFNGGNSINNFDNKLTHKYLVTLYAC